MKQHKSILVLILLAFLLLPLLTQSLTLQNSITTLTPTRMILDNDPPLINNFSNLNETLIKHSMSVKINQDNSLAITSTFVLANNDTKPLNFFVFIINKTIDSVFCFDLISSLPFTWTVNTQFGNKLNVTLRYPILENEIYAFSLSYKIRDIIFQVEGAFEYLELDLEIMHPRNTLSFNLEMNLPIYAELLEAEEPLKPFFPTPIRVREENSIVTIIWELANRFINQSDLFLVRYILSTVYLTTGTSYRLLFNMLSLLGGLVIGAGSILLYLVSRRKSITSTEKQLVTSLLSKSEQDIIKAINLDGGISTQRRICDKTGYSKSKVSKILTKLEEKEVLERNRWGRTNKVTIKNDSFKKLDSEVNFANEIDEDDD
ncbi:MAG: winged helix-turn-helix transcriptional regulator [Candidatus Heimdallarchaeota archaeon]|nr:winged helix-turn-helix transcriptional regulator [Candidatus Heimdallarchaeota archaeon]